MRVLKHNGLAYYISEGEQEDKVLRALMGHELGAYELQVNLSTSRILVPHLLGYSFISTMGCENSGPDDWTKFELKLYRKLREFPKHCKFLHNACLLRETGQVANLMAVFMTLMPPECTCDLCRKGLTSMVMELVMETSEECASQA